MVELLRDSRQVEYVPFPMPDAAKLKNLFQVRKMKAVEAVKSFASPPTKLFSPFSLHF